MANAVATNIADEHSYSLTDPAKPLHHQQIERALCLQPLLNQVESIFDPRSQSQSDGEEPSEVSDIEDGKAHYDLEGNKTVNGIVTTRSERKADKTRIYNFTRIKKNRRWLRTILLSDSSSDEDDEPYTKERLRDMLKVRRLERKYQAQFYQNPEMRQYQYYGSGLLAYNDRFPEQQRLILGPKKKTIRDFKKMDKKTLKAKLKKMKKGKVKDLNHRQKVQNMPPEVLKQFMHQSHHMKERAHKTKKLTPEQIAAKRKKIWHTIVKKEIPKAYKQKVSARKEMLSSAKKLAQQCMKEARRSAIQSQKNMRETPLRARRLTREMMTYWKRFEKVEKEHRKRVHKEAQEQRKLDLNLLEARRQQRKLNFLITQTELYAHFMSRKLTGATEKDKENILKRLDENPLQKEREVDGGLLTDELEDEYDDGEIKNIAIRNAKDALAQQNKMTHAFDTGTNKPSSSYSSLESSFANPSISTEVDQPQPSIFEGKLKGYQLKGMNWLVNLYNQGINGILADEMGLGKTIQSMALIAHLAENLGIWGPFLVVAPASTLHNWQQECARFIPKLKVVPYWGNTQDRRVLRKFWNQSHLHTQDASFHVLITSYQLVIQDVKYFQRIKWHYMILDEAQALKSSSSVRWKILLGFTCRNRLLLTGTPIQNSMAELWALLHFIMPTLFDSHDEFNEWFSKDIESHAEKQSGIDENQLSRLHMILKPFMLRRVKKDVENELSDKIEILVFCPLTTRQRFLYQAIKNKIRIEDLIQSSSSSNTSQAQSTTSSLMNLVMQFRKVCNHPELFERRETRSPLFLPQELVLIPKLVYRGGLLDKALPSREKIVHNMFCIYKSENIHRSVFPSDQGDEKKSRCFSFLRFIDMSPGEMESTMLAGLLVRWLAVFLWLKEAYRIHHRYTWKEENQIQYRYCTNKQFLLEPERTTYFPNITTSDHLQHLVFTSHTSAFHSHTKHVFHCIPETIGHRKIRQRNLRAKHRKTMVTPTSPTKSPTTLQRKGPPFSPVKKLHSSHTSADLDMELALQHPHVEREPVTFECQATFLPSFLYYSTPKVTCRSRDWYSADRSAMWDNMRAWLCGSLDAWKSLLYGLPDVADVIRWSRPSFHHPTVGGVYGAAPKHGFSNVFVPDKETLVTDAGKLHVLDSLLGRLKSEGHRVLIYSQMTRMIDLLEEYMWHRKHTYMRLDGSSKISDRRDMVADFQNRSDIFVFLLSTRAGGLGINLTAADTVIFYDSDWNPTVDQQAMDRAHRLGQTKQVTVYRLICKGSIEERILQRAREKSEIQRMVISGGSFRPDTLKPKEVVSLLIDDDEMKKKLRAREEERKVKDENNKTKDRKRKRDNYVAKGRGRGKKKASEEVNVTIPADEVSIDSMSMSVPSPGSVMSFGSEMTSSQFAVDESSNEGALVIVDEPNSHSPAVTPPPKRGRGRGRPKGSGVGGRPRGRGRVQKAISAAEIAGAQAGMTAAYAAFGYNFKGTQSASQVTSPPKTASAPRSPRSSRQKSSPSTS